MGLFTKLKTFSDETKGYNAIQKKAYGLLVDLKEAADEEYKDKSHINFKVIKISDNHFVLNVRNSLNNKELTIVQLFFYKPSHAPLDVYAKFYALAESLVLSEEDVKVDLDALNIYSKYKKFVDFRVYEGMELVELKEFLSNEFLQKNIVKVTGSEFLYTKLVDEEGDVAYYNNLEGCEND